VRKMIDDGELPPPPPKQSAPSGAADTAPKESGPGTRRAPPK
jgi:hypothetical protein